MPSGHEPDRDIRDRGRDRREVVPVLAVPIEPLLPVGREAAEPVGRHVGQRQVPDPLAGLEVPQQVGVRTGVRWRQTSAASRIGGKHQVPLQLATDAEDARPDAAAVGDHAAREDRAQARRPERCGLPLHRRVVRDAVHPDQRERPGQGLRPGHGTCAVLPVEAPLDPHRQKGPLGIEPAAQVLHDDHVAVGRDRLGHLAVVRLVAAIRRPMQQHRPSPAARTRGRAHRPVHVGAQRHAVGGRHRDGRLDHDPVHAGVGTQSCPPISRSSSSASTSPARSWSTLAGGRSRVDRTRPRRSRIRSWAAKNASSPRFGIERIGR